MPRVNQLIRQDPRAAELRGEIARLQGMTGKSYKELCRIANLEYGTFMAHKITIENMRMGELWKFRDACEKIIKHS